MVPESPPSSPSSARTLAAPIARPLSVAAFLGALGAVLYACAASEPPSSYAGDGGGNMRDGAAVDGPPLIPPRPSDAGPAGDCARYCSLVSESCTGSFAQYTDTAQCMAVCGALPAGIAGDREGNTVACRQTYAGNVAKTDPTTYCPAAGPFGGGVCGERCDAFCGLAFAICPRAPWESTPACVTACTNLRFTETGDDSGEGLAGPMFGDTLNCRTRRLLEALAVPEECNEIGKGGACMNDATVPGRDE